MVESLNITIVGGGLAGLAAARVLREHHNVTIFERSSSNHEVGAALSVGPTAAKFLVKLGFDHRRVQSILWESTTSFDKNGKLLDDVRTTRFREPTDSDWDCTLCHRIDLWNEMFRLATAPSEELGIGGQPARIVWKADVVDCDVEAGKAIISDGTTIDSDLVIASDGIRSTIRPLVVGEAAFHTARPSGVSAFRFTMPIDQARHYLQAPDFQTLDRGNVEIYLSMDGTARSVVMYPCRNYTILNAICLFPDEMITAEATESWTAEGNRDDMLSCIQDYHPTIKELFQQAENIKLWQLRDQDPLPTYTKGRTFLVGDAAHAMTPHQAQGANQAFEDAEAFTLLNSPNITRASVPAILKDIDRVRRRRASQIQNNTRETLDRKTPDAIYKHMKYNYTYPGIKECLRRLDAGEEMIPV